MATFGISPPFPAEDQQQPQQEAIVPNPEAVSSNGWHSSGSIGPFFAVISVLTVLAIISCILGRICRRKKLSPLECIKYKGCFGWLRSKCCFCTSSHRDSDVLGNKSAVGEIGSSDAKAQDVV